MTGSLEGPNARSASETTSYIPETPTSVDFEVTVLRFLRDRGPATAGPGLDGSTSWAGSALIGPRLRGPCGKRSRSISTW